MIREFCLHLHAGHSGTHSFRPLRGRSEYAEVDAIGQL